MDVTLQYGTGIAQTNASDAFVSWDISYIELEIQVMGGRRRWSKVIALRISGQLVHLRTQK